MYHQIKYMLLYRINILISLLSLAFFFFLSHTLPGLQKNFIKLAAENTDNSILPDKIFGKPDASETSPNQIVGNRVFHPQGITVDRNTSPNRVYVFDSGNSRILGFSSLGTCMENQNIPCTTKFDCPSQGNCSINPNREADIVIGQVDKYHGSCNGDNSSWKLASASTLCSQPYPETKTAMESPDGTVMAVDSNHNLYIHDKYNNRILKFNDPFVEDTVADFVWGQPDFNKRGRNFSSAGDIDSSNFYYYGDTVSSNVSSRGLSWGKVGGNYLAGGVDVDLEGNIWIADSGNNRVLRFPPNSKEANLVLGQPDFFSRKDYAAVALGDVAGKKIPLSNYLYNPKVVKYNQTTNQVFVIDWPCNICLFRILIFNAPFSNGMEPSEVLLGDQNQVVQGETARNNYDFRFHRISGLEFDPQNPHNFWLSNANRLNYFEKIDGSWRATKVIGQKSINEFTTEVSCNNSSEDGDHSRCRIESTNGGIGIDSAGNIYATDLNSQEVKIFLAPIPDELRGYAYGGEFFLKSQGGVHNGNYVSGFSFRDPSAVLLANNQLLVADQKRVLFWNDYQNKQPNSEADGIIFANSPNDTTSAGRKEILQMTVDSQNRVWMAGPDGVFVFQGPLTDRQPPLEIISPFESLPVRTNSQPTTIRLGNVFSGLAYDSEKDVLWLADSTNHRIVRISSPLSQSGIIVNMVIGQSSPENSGPNRSKDDPSKNWCPTLAADSFSTLGKIYLDQEKNLYVIDGNYEGWICSNNRLLEFDAADLVPDSEKIFFADGEKTAKRVYGGSDFTRHNFYTRYGDNIPKTPLSVSFSNNKMFMSVDGYGNPALKRLFVFGDYLPSADELLPSRYVQSWGAIPVRGAQLAETSFDNSGNLAILDHTWNRVLYFSHAAQRPEFFDQWQKPTTFPEALTPTTPPCWCSNYNLPLRRNGNANCDNAIDLLDFTWWQLEFMTTNAKSQLSDFNCDKVINLVDFSIWLATFSQRL